MKESQLGNTQNQRESLLGQESVQRNLLNLGSYSGPSPLNLSHLHLPISDGGVGNVFHVNRDTKTKARKGGSLKGATVREGSMACTKLLYFDYSNETTAHLSGHFLHPGAFGGGVS